MTSEAQTPIMATTELASTSAKLPKQTARLIWGSFGLALLMLLGVCIGLFHQLGVGYSDIAPRLLANQTALRVNYIASEARMMNQLLDQIALRFAYEGRNLDLKALVKQGVIDPQIVAKVQILDARGELLLSSLEAPLGINLSHTHAFRTHASANNGRMLIEASAFGGGHPQEFAGFSQRLNGPDGVFSGVVLASFSANHLSQAFVEMQIRFDGVSHLVGLDGEIRTALLGPDHRQIRDYKDHPFPALLRQGVTHGSYEKHPSEGGFNRDFVFRKVPDLDLVVVSSVAARGWDGLLSATKQVFYASAATLIAALLILFLNFRGHSIRLNHALAQKEQLANQLRTSEERLSLAVMSGRLGTWDWRLQDERFRTNELFNALFRPWPQKINFQSGVLQEQIHPEDSASFVRSLRLHMRGETPDFFSECRLRDPAGHWKWARVIGRVTERGPDGGPLRLSGTVMDITEQRTLQTRVKDRSNQLNTIFALSQDALVVFDQNRLVKLVNPAFKRLTQLEPGLVQGLDETQFTEKLNEVCAPGQHFCGLPALREPAQVAGTRTQKSLVLQGPVARVLMATLTTSNSGSVSQILSLRDVSHESLIEKLKSEFLSTAAHEIRSPMSSILGFAELMTDTEVDASARREYSNIILSQAHRIKGLLDELLDLARIDAGGGQHFTFAPVDLRELVTRVVAEFIPPDGRPAPTINVPPQLCRIDFDKAAQALLNVISNAYKYSDKTSPVNILYVPPTASNNQDMAGITVQDSGIGMSQAEQQRVFERFYRVNQKTAVAGSGLGMAIVKEIMMLHGGEVVIKSVYGQGTAVTLMFPLDRQLPPPPALLAEPERIRI
jgi:signal transduction histidine kinase